MGPNNDTGALATTNSVSLVFYIDGQSLSSNGANQLCLTTMEPQFDGFAQQSGSVTRLTVTLAKPGKHMLSVEFYAGVQVNGTNLYPFLAQTHVSVAH